MVYQRLASAFAAAVLVSSAFAQSSTQSIKNPIPEPTKQLPASAIVEVGCFSTGYPLENHGPSPFQTDGKCQLICLGLDKPVMGLSDGENCWCGDKIPPKEAQIKNSSCDTTCSGGDEWLCGGPNLVWVDLTGSTRNKVENADPPVSSSSSSSAPAQQQTSQTAQTAAPTESKKPEEDKGPNTAAIAAGVVVGVVALGAIIGGVFLFMRNKKRRDLEEDHRRQAAVNSFVAGGILHTSNSSMTDSRLDPNFMNRRASNGSIADNEDYSRRILKVTNA